VYDPQDVNIHSGRENEPVLNVADVVFITALMLVKGHVRKSLTMDPQGAACRAEQPWRFAYPGCFF